MKYFAFLFIFMFSSVCLLADTPYILETGPERGAGLPFFSEDLSLYFTGTYVHRDSAFRVRVFYTADRPNLSRRKPAKGPSCSAGLEYSSYFWDADSGSENIVTIYTLFESKGWNPYFSPEEDPSPQEPKKGHLFFVVLDGDDSELCVFIPLFEERLRYYMNARKNEISLPLPAVIATK